MGLNRTFRISQRSSKHDRIASRRCFTTLHDFVEHRLGKSCLGSLGQGLAKASGAAAHLDELPDELREKSRLSNWVALQTLKHGRRASRTTTDDALLPPWPPLHPSFWIR